MENKEEYTIYNFYNEIDLQVRKEHKTDRLGSAVLLKKIIHCWDLRLYDQLGFIISPMTTNTKKRNSLYNYEEFSFHHARITQYEKGPTTIHNGAALVAYSGHPELHIVEHRCPELYAEIKKLLIEINEQYSHPTRKQLLLSNELFCIFERQFSAATNVKDEPLIKEVYTRRLNPKNISNYYGLSHYKK